VRVERLLSLLWFLMSGRKLSAGALAGELGVSPRTIRRDVDHLSAAGIPVYWEPGRSGGPRLLPGFRGILPALTEGEAQALLVSCISATQSLFGVRQERESALRKLEASLGELRGDAGMVVARYVLIDPLGWLPAPVPATIHDLQTAILGQYRCAIRYYSRSNAHVVNHTVDPGGLVNSGGEWYFIAFHRGRPRCYNAGRVISVRAYTEPAKVPSTFVLRDYWNDVRSSWLNRLHPVEALVRIRARAIPLLHESVRPADFDWNLVHSHQWLDQRLLFKDFPHAVAVLTAMSDDVVVLSPEELRLHMLHRAENLVALYDSPPGE